MNVKIACVQPRSYSGEETEKNVAAALAYIEEAADNGAQMILLPEGYPGPYASAYFDPMPALCEKAKERGVYVISGGVENDGNGAFYVVQNLINPKGEHQGIYRRTTPVGPYIYHDISEWGFDYVNGDQLPVFDTEFGKLGILICSEVYVPELSRVLMLKGAEIIVYPAGAYINELMPTWQNLIWSRAIENIAYTAVCQNLYGDEPGVAMIAGPEKVIAKRSDVGIIYGELDMDRLHWLRAQKEVVETPKKYSVAPGTREWRRGELYKNNCELW